MQWASWSIQTILHLVTVWYKLINVYCINTPYVIKLTPKHCSSQTSSAVNVFLILSHPSSSNALCQLKEPFQVVVVVFFLGTLIMTFLKILDKNLQPQLGIIHVTSAFTRHEPTITSLLVLTDAIPHVLAKIVLVGKAMRTERANMRLDVVVNVHVVLKVLFAVKAFPTHGTNASMSVWQHRDPSPRPQRWHSFALLLSSQQQALVWSPWWLKRKIGGPWR